MRIAGFEPRIREMFGSKLGRYIAPCNSDILWFTSVPPGKLRRIVPGLLYDRFLPDPHQFSI